MKVTKEEAIKLFVAIGYKTATDWDVGQLQKKIKKLPETADGVKIRKNKKMSILLSKVLATFKNKKAVKVYDPDDAAAGKQRDRQVDGAAKRDVAKKDEKKQEKKKKKKKEKVEKKAKKEAKKKEPKKPSTKQLIYAMYQKVKPENAKEHAEKWYKEINKKVKLSTIRGWISMWKGGNGLPKGA